MPYSKLLRSASRPALVIALLAWALAATTLLERRPFGLDEALARALLVLWSASDHVVNPVVTLGVPDARALLLAPVGIFFPGSLIAAKLATLLVALVVVVGLYLHRAERGATDSALPATGLLLLSPALLSQVDAAGTGIWLLGIFVLGAAAHEVHRKESVAFGGWYFLQLMLCFLAITLHPAGLALALVLARLWWAAPASAVPAAQGVIPGSGRAHTLIGLAAVTVAGLAWAHGWPDAAWLHAPPVALAGIFLAFAPMTGAGAWVLGTALLVLLVALVAIERQRLREEPLFAVLALALLIGLASADGAWALLAAALLAHWGLALLLRSPARAARALTLAALIATFTVFLQQDRLQFEMTRIGRDLSPTDQLLSTLSQAVELASAQHHPSAATPGGAQAPDPALDPAANAASAAPTDGPPDPQQEARDQAAARAALRVASQWPARAMVACSCTVLPLPPAVDDPARFAANLRGLSFLAFDPRTPHLQPLARNFAQWGGDQVETLALQDGGVLLRVNHAAKAQP